MERTFAYDLPIGPGSVNERPEIRFNCVNNFLFLAGRFVPRCDSLIKFYSQFLTQNGRPMNGNSFIYSILSCTLFLSSLSHTSHHFAFHHSHRYVPR